MKSSEHLSNDLLVRFLDDELSAAEADVTGQHLDECTECRQSYLALSRVSKSVENFVASMSPHFPDAHPDGLAGLLTPQVRPPQIHRTPRPPQNVLRRFAWGMALAASLAFGIMLAPRFTKHDLNAPATAQNGQQSASFFEVDGETFVPLPYSNPDLPVAAHHIIQMQVPVSSLADAGVHFEAISNEVSRSDESVLADVLLGIDGQPLGVHVLTFE